MTETTKSGFVAMIDAAAADQAIADTDSDAEYWEKKAGEWHEMLTKTRQQLDDIEDEIEMEKKELMGKLHELEIMLKTIKAGYYEYDGEKPAIYGQLGHCITFLTGLQIELDDMGGWK